MKNNVMILGALESPKDKRDIDLGSVVSPQAIPETYLPIYGIVSLFQGHQPACSSFAGAHLKEIQELLDVKSTDKLSAQYLWDKIKDIDGVPAEQGTYARAIFKTLKSQGICIDEIYPTNVKLSIPEFAEDKTTSGIDAEAQFRIIKSYGKMMGKTDMDLLRRLIYNSKAVLIRIVVDDGFWGTQYPTFTKKRWGHFVIADGYDGNNIRIIDSADPNEKMRIKYIANKYADFITESWTSIDISTKKVKLLTSELAILRLLVKLYIKLLKLLKVGK